MNGADAAVWAQWNQCRHRFGKGQMNIWSKDKLKKVTVSHKSSYDLSSSLSLSAQANVLIHSVAAEIHFPPFGIYLCHLSGVPVH